MRILVIDDYKSHGESLVELLKTLGHEGLYAQSFTDAQWLLDLFRFDVAILDFDMPAVSGPEAAQDLAKRFPEMQAVIVSAHTPEGDRLTCLGELPFLPKPVVHDTLRSLLEEFARARLGSVLIRRTGFPMIKYE